MNSYQKEYFDVWKKTFSLLLGWKEAQLIVWAQPLLQSLGKPGMVLNEPPLYYVARELVWTQPYYDDLSQSEKHNLIREVQAILSPHHERGLSESFDTVVVKAQLRELLDRNA